MFGVPFFCYGPEKSNVMRLLEHPYQIHDTSDKLPMSFVDIYSHLGNQRVSEGKLRQGIAGDGELTDTDHTDAEL